MAFFKNLVQSIKTAFGGVDEEKQAEGIAKQRDTLSSYQNATMQRPPQPAQTVAQQQATTQSSGTTTTSAAQPVHHVTPQAQAAFTDVSDIVEHAVQPSAAISLDILCDSLGLSRKKITADRGVVSVPFDASGCDFETKRQIAQAVAKEFGLITNVMPTNIACTEAAKRAFGAIKAAREECFVCGTLLLAINQDIDEEGFMLAEVTNTHNGNSVFFDIPASVAPDGATNVNYDLIVHNVLIARDKTM